MPVERLLFTRLPLPLRNDRPVETIKPSIELATCRNEGNEDRAVRRRKREATRRNRTRRDRTRRNRTRRNRQRITLSLTLKIVYGNKIVDIRDIITILQAALRTTPGQPLDVRRLRTRGTCP